MDALLRLQSVLDQISYKPGWTFTAARGYKTTGGLNLSEVFLRVAYETADVNFPKRETTINSVRELPASFLETMPELAIIEFVRHVIQEAENHETSEWLKYRGICVRDPHPATPSPSVP
jgi:hypothetical protein